MQELRQFSLNAIQQPESRRQAAPRVPLSMRRGPADGPPADSPKIAAGLFHKLTGIRLFGIINIRKTFI